MPHPHAIAIWPSIPSQKRYKNLTSIYFGNPVHDRRDAIDAGLIFSARSQEAQRNEAIGLLTRTRLFQQLKLAHRAA